MLSREGISNLRDLVTRPSNLDHVPPHGHGGGRERPVAISAFLFLARGTARQVGLVLPTLRVRQVGAIVLVDGEAEAALEAADVVLEEVGVLVEVDGFEGELAKSFAAVRVGC